MTRGPILIDLEDREPPVSVADAPPVPDAPAPDGQAMQMAARLAARRPSRLASWFWGLAGAVVGAMVSVAAWDFVTGLLARAPVFGMIVTVLFVAMLGVLLVIALRELAAIARLGRIDSLHRAADTALAEEDLEQARAVTKRLLAFYAGRDDTRWGR